jgi:voltage-gated potassium channel
MVVALLFLGAYAWPILDPGLAEPWVRLCTAVTWLAWAAFALDYAVRLALAPDRRRFVRRNLLDLAVVVLPLLRPLRVLRVVWVLEILNRKAADSLRGRVASFVVTGTGLVMFVASLAALDAERGHPDANIVTFKDAVWWSFATITTVGYGDHYPVTDAGRLIAAALMVCGIGLLGVVTGWLASWLIDRVSEAEEEAQTATRRDVADLAAEVAALREELSRRDLR